MKMTTKIFVNMPVKDLPKSIAFFTAMGYTFNPQFTDDTATCMIISEDIYAMLLTEPRFKDFAPRAVCDAHQSTEMLIALSCDTRGQVDELVSKAIEAGATTFKDPQDHGFMYLRSFQDLDGHIWEIFYMDPTHVQPQA
jgi:predicted lactoylglutathione lyase